MNNGYIYIRFFHNYPSVCKMGKTENIVNRDNVYATGEFKRGVYKLVIEIEANQTFDDSKIEKILQNNFKKYHSKLDGGNEFYKIEIVNEIVDYLNETSLKFKVLSNNEINNLLINEAIQHHKAIFKKVVLILKNKIKKKKQINKICLTMNKNILYNYFLKLKETNVY